MPEPYPGVKAPAKPGVAPPVQGVILGDMELGDAMDPKNIPVPPTPPIFVGISIAYLHFSASSNNWKQPVPPGMSWPSMIFSDTPLI